MVANFIVSNERQAREIATQIETIDQALTSEQLLKSIVKGLPREVIDGVRRSLNSERRELAELLETYSEAKSGNFELLRKRARHDLGDFLIAARLIQGWSQKELARKLGLREQAIQRYEAERYRSISLGSYIKVARALSVRVTADFLSPLTRNNLPPLEVSSNEAQKVLKHARANDWLQNKDESDENCINQLIRDVAEHVENHGAPSLLRTGLNVEDHSSDWTLLAWKTQIARRAKLIIDNDKIRYQPVNFSWLGDLVKLSKQENGPLLAQDLLKEQGIILIVEPHIAGMKVDGAAFLVEQTPIIGMTLLRDTLDNFWFTLLHEVAHVILHYRTGLAAGFFDDTEAVEVDELEEEANKFASSMLIPEELWSRSPARIAKAAAPIECFAEQLGISPAIVFGRVRLERKNYAIFSEKIGRGTVRKQFLPSL